MLAMRATASKAARLRKWFASFYFGWTMAKIGWLCIFATLTGEKTLRL